MLRKRIMSETQPPRLHPIIPGETVPGDWYSGRIPENMEVGENCVVDSSFCFKHFFSVKKVGLRMGSHVTIWRASLAPEENGIIEIGDHCYISNASLVASDRITIGSRVMVAGGVTIADSDFHPLEPAARIADTIALSPRGDRHHRPSVTSAPVEIGDDVWIGFNATILKGVHIGSGAVIAPGALVIRDVPVGVQVAGNPASPVEVSP
jgi:acetyltransferase-like isoleucine patch superfamily enzyme